MRPAPVRPVRLRRSSARLVLRTAVAAVLGAALVACSGTPTATPVVGSISVSTSASTAVSAPASTTPTLTTEPADLTSSSAPPTSAPASSAAAPPPLSSTAPPGDCVGPFGYSGQRATLIATQGEITCEEMTAAWNLFLAEFPERSGQIFTTSAGWRCTWVDGPGPRGPEAVEGDESGPGCIKEGRSFGPLLNAGGDGSGAGGGTDAGCVYIGGGGSSVGIFDSTISCDEARRIDLLPGDSVGGKRVTKGDGWDCIYGGYGDDWVTECFNESTGDHFSVGSPDQTQDGGGSGQSGSGSAGSVTTPLSNVGCDGTGIVILRSATEPASYQRVIDEALAANPGASVLRTDASCSSLAQATAAGDPIYAVYRPTGSSDRGTVCDAVGQAGGDAYGKWLDAALSPDESRIDC